MTQPSNGVIQEELTGFREASIVVPAIALIVAALVGALACAARRRPAPATPQLAITIAAAGVVGVGIGLAGAAIGGPELAESVHLPEHVGANNLGVALLGLLLAAIVGAVALGIGRLMRVGDDDSLGVGPAVVTAVAAAAAVICVVAPGGVVDSAEATLDAAARLEQVSAQVAFATPVNPTLLAQLEAIDGIAEAEPVPSANVFVRHASRRYSTSLEAFPRDTTLQQFEAPNGDRIELPAEGALIPQSLGKILGAGVGDQIEVTLPGAGVPPFKVPVAALTSNTLGNLVFLSNDGTPQRDGRSTPTRSRAACSTPPRCSSRRVPTRRRWRRRCRRSRRWWSTCRWPPTSTPSTRRDRSSRPSSRPCSPSPPSSPCSGLAIAVVLHTRTRAASAAGA